MAVFGLLSDDLNDDGVVATIQVPTTLPANPVNKTWRPVLQSVFDTVRTGDLWHPGSLVNPVWKMNIANDNVVVFDDPRKILDITPLSTVRTTNNVTTKLDFEIRNAADTGNDTTEDADRLLTFNDGVLINLTFINGRVNNVDVECNTAGTFRFDWCRELRLRNPVIVTAYPEDRVPDDYKRR